MQEVDDKKLSDLSKRFLQAISYCGLSGYKLKKDNIISSESTLTSIKKGIQLPSKKTIDAFCEKYDVSRAWLYTGEGLFAKTPSGQIEPSEKDIRDALKNARMQSDSTISMISQKPISHCMMIGYMLRAIHSRQYITIINVTNVISTRP